jgi:hypothetical protein
MIDRILYVERRERVDVRAVERIDPGANDAFRKEHW